MERVLYFSGFRLSAFHWQKHKLLGHYTFDPSDNGYTKFDEYLKQTKHIPTRLLVDIIEEDFKQESIPCVRGKDRESLVKRNLDRLFRGSDYTATLNQGKDKKNKNKETVLFSALTNPGLMKPWLNKLENMNVPFIGIWSVPMMSHQLFKHLKINNQLVLLISQQVPSSLRQSFYSNGKLVFSRLSKVKLDLRDVKDAMSYAVLLANEIEQTERYLTNQRLIPYDQVLTVCCLVRSDFEKDLVSYLESTQEIEYRIYSIDKLDKKLGFKSKDSPYSDILFSRLCYLQSSKKDYYSLPKERKYFNEFRIRNIIFKATLACFFSSIIASMFFIFNGLQLKEEAAQITKISEQRDQFYNENFGHLEHMLAKATTMQSAVELSKALIAEAQISPKSFIVTLSNIISKTNYDSLIFDSIHWKKDYAANLENLAREDDSQDPYAEVDDYSEDGSAPKVHLVTLKARVPVNTLPYRVIVDTVNQFIAEVEKKPFVESITIVDLPIDTRQNSSFSDENVSPLLKKENEKSDGKFTIQIVMKEPSHV